MRKILPVTYFTIPVTEWPFSSSMVGGGECWITYLSSFSYFLSGHRSLAASGPRDVPLLDPLWIQHCFKVDLVSPRSDLNESTHEFQSKSPFHWSIRLFSLTAVWQQSTSRKNLNPFQIRQIEHTQIRIWWTKSTNPLESRITFTNLVTKPQTSVQILLLPSPSRNFPSSSPSYKLQHVRILLIFYLRSNRIYARVSSQSHASLIYTNRYSVLEKINAQLTL